jgi:hypothetical protein
MDDPSDQASLDELSFRIDQSVKPVLVSPTELEEGLQRNYHGSGSAAASAPAPQSAAVAPAPRLASEPKPAHGAPPDSEPTLPPMQVSAPVSEPARPRPDDADTEPQLPPMDAMPDTPDLKDLDEDPVLGGFANDPALRGDDLDDPAAMSFSAAGEEPLADLSEAPFGETDPDMGGFAGGPFGTSDGEEFGDLELSFGEDVADTPEPESASQSSASSAALEANVIMQALAQLLVEKGVIGRDEFAERIRRLAAKHPKPA